jgi:hypothetical protein
VREAAVDCAEPRRAFQLQWAAAWRRVELDVNPLIARVRGAVAVDALLRWQD